MAQRHSPPNDPSWEADAGAASANATGDSLPASTVPRSTPAVSGPFAWQHEERLFLLDADEDIGGWVVAELRFEAPRCRYVEIRRARYRWEREATSALLSRVLAAGEPVVDRAAQALQRWLAADHHPAGDRGRLPSV